MRLFACTLLFVSLAFAQSQAFEVATIKPSPMFRRMNLTSVRLDKSQVSFNALSLSSVIAIAYRVHPSQVLAPDWLNTSGFTITAKLPAGASIDKVPEMLQNLLAERFQMKARRENRELPVYIVTAGKRPLPPLDKTVSELTTDAAGDEASVVQTPLGEMKMTNGANGVQILGSGLRVSMGRDGVRMEMSTTATLAKLLAADADRPVVDKTGLTGEYRIVVNINNRQEITKDDVPRNREFDAVEESLGFHVNPGKESIEAIVIDRIEKTPSEN